jgi:hypothetical protein
MAKRRSDFDNPFELTLAEMEAHQDWARRNYVPLSEIIGVWHPVVQLECVKMNFETGAFDPDKRDTDKVRHNI